ncbi:MAG: mRNA interferase MqsR [Alphaproteobacteria bacterium]|nr:MAG: mRNA interferase MqsR [Alphaproteobacteria bacterium]
MDKRKPHYSLAAIKKQFREPKGFRITVSAQDFAFGALGLERQGILDLVQSVETREFYKSMTSYGSSSIWQDVYHVRYEDSVLYLKFTKDTDGHYLLISLKDR